MSNTNEPSKTSAHLQSMKGGMKEGVGSMTGSASMQQAGREEKLQAEAELKAAQAQGHAQGTKERMAGKKDEVVGSMTGDTSQQATGTARREQGTAQQETNRYV